MKETLAFPTDPSSLPYPPGKASDYIRHAPKEIKPGDKVVIYPRVSYHTQDRKGNLDDQERNLRSELALMGAIIVDIVRCVGPGWEPIGIAAAAAKAREHGAKLVAETTSRIIRPFGYHSSRNPDAQASEGDLRWLKAGTGEVILVTLLDPDASPAEERAYQTRRGQEAKGRKGGRPAKKPAGHKKDRRCDMLPVVLRLHGKGLSVRKIAERTGVPRATVQDWIGRDEAAGEGLKGEVLY